MRERWFIFAPLISAIFWLVWHAVNVARPVAADPASSSWQGAPPTLTLNDAEEIFKRAFLRRNFHPKPTLY